MSDTTAIEKVDYAPNKLEQAAQMRGVYSSIDAKDFATRLQILKLVNEAVPIDEHLGEVFELRDVVVQAVDTFDEETGEPRSYERVILISDGDKAYVGASKGLMNAIRTTFRIIGEPNEWDAPIPVTVTREGPRGRQYFVLNLA